MELQTFFQTINDKLLSRAAVSTVNGEPIIVGEKKVVSVAKVACGFGGVGVSGACISRLNLVQMESNLATRLNRVAGERTLTLTHYGRKSGRPYNVKIWFVVDGDNVYIGTVDVNHQWIRNVQKTSRVRLSIGSENFNGEARFLADRAEHERAIALLRRKYWLFQPIFALARILTRMRNKTGSFEVTLSG
jgi:deazaflavin-dependent oxidoreductase (nitroreductase family)